MERRKDTDLVAEANKVEQMKEHETSPREETLWKKKLERGGTQSDWNAA